MFHFHEAECSSELSRAQGWSQTHFPNYSVVDSNWLPLMDWLPSIYLRENNPSCSYWKSSAVPNKEQATATSTCAKCLRTRGPFSCNALNVVMSLPLEEVGLTFQMWALPFAFRAREVNLPLFLVVTMQSKAASIRGTELSGLAWHSSPHCCEQNLKHPE